MGDKADAVTILIIVFVNAVLGFVQEFKTEKSLEALQELAAPTCKVIRDGSLKVITSRELTLGDVVVVEAGDRIPADGKFIDDPKVLVDVIRVFKEEAELAYDRKHFLPNYSYFVMVSCIISILPVYVPDYEDMQRAGDLIIRRNARLCRTRRKQHDAAEVITQNNQWRIQRIVEDDKHEPDNIQ